MIFFNYIFLLFYNIFFITNYFDIVCTEFSSLITPIIKFILTIKEGSTSSPLLMCEPIEIVEEQGKCKNTSTNNILYMKEINKLASFVGKTLDTSETVKLAKLPDINKLHAKVHYKIIDIAINDELNNVKAVFNPNNFGIEHYKRISNVATHFNNIQSNPLSNIICNKIKFNCGLVNIQHTGLINSLPRHIYNGLKHHPSIYCKLDNDLSLICPLTHSSPYEGSTVIGIDSKNNKKMEAIPFFIELKTSFCKNIIIKPESDVIKAYSVYEDNLNSHVASIVDTRINISKIYICNTSLYVPCKLENVSSADIERYIEESNIILDSKTKYELDHIKEKLKLKIK